ncbi:MAG: nucleotidyltransferase family protein [Treponema sp.]|nr:nucleotidyltransferase family protein [Treponema sp.]
MTEKHESPSGGVCAILMASGFSKRFGDTNKLLASFRGKPLARHTLDLVCGLDCFSRIIFAAAEDPVLALAGGLPVTAVRNEHPERGQRESIRLGLEANPAAEWYMFFPCDQPLLNAAVVRRVVAARRPGHIVLPCCRGEPGNPVLFSGLFRDELLTLGQGERGRDIIRRHSESLIRLEIAPIPGLPFPGSPLTDIDDPRTLARLEGAG